ncbi:MAG: radical SAM protein [Anaerolineae bacterium]|nr:radical SAM protein [Anaerolineae bacterium]
MSPVSLPPVLSAPLSVDIAITGRCNLHCGYCFYADEMVALRDLPGERWQAFFVELGQLAVQRVSLTGGEAFTRPDLFELIDGVVANRMRYNILSNGTLITEETLCQFEAGKRRQRLDYIQVSIDGSRAEIHDKSRPNSFERAIRGLRLLVEARFPATVRVTVNRYNVDDLENVARLLLEEIGLPAFSTNEAEPGGMAKRQADEIALTPAQRRRAMAVLPALAERYNGRINAQAGPLALAREFQFLEDCVADGLADLPGRGTLSSCGGVFSKLAVHHDGTIVPCHWLPSLHLGQIGVDDLQTIWREHPVLDKLRCRRTIPLHTLPTCRDCPYASFCRGGCPGQALLLTGELDVRSPMTCYRLYRERQRLSPVEKVVV